MSGYERAEHPEKLTRCELKGVQKSYPIVARTATFHRPIGPISYDCVKIIIVRSGSAILFSAFGQRPVNVGDVILLGSNTLCGSEPEGHITVTTLYLDSDYIVDQVFWQYATVLSDRMDARDFAGTIYSEPAQVLKIGAARAGMLMPWLDEMVRLSLDGDMPTHFYRMQSRLFAIADVIAPFIKTTPVRLPFTQRARTRPTLPRYRRFHPLRAEAVQVRDLMHNAIAGRWTLPLLAERVHLSPKQLSRVFTDTYGKTPLAYLTMLRVEAMARLLRETDLSVSAAAHAVGWESRSRAAEAFRECVGVTPRQYRAIGTFVDNS